MSEVSSRPHTQRNTLMEEQYWKSTPKYWCKHCSAYVKDTPFERRQHEATAKHQGNLKRSLRDIQNNHERGERDKERAKTEVERLNKIVGGSIADSGTTRTSAKRPTPAYTRNPPAAKLSAEDQKRQWQQLAEMGIQVPDDYRAEMAMAGDWKSVAQIKPDHDVATNEDTSVGIRKRKLDEQEQEDIDAGEEPTAKRVWGRTVRRYPGQETEDLNSLLAGKILLKSDKEGEEAVKLEPDVTSSEDATHGGSNGSTIDKKVAAKISVTSTKQAPHDDTLQRIKGENHVGNQGTAEPAPPNDEVAMPVFKKRKNKGTKS